MNCHFFLEIFCMGVLKNWEYWKNEAMTMTSDVSLLNQINRRKKTWTLIFSRISFELENTEIMEPWPLIVCPYTSKKNSTQLYFFSRISLMRVLKNWRILRRWRWSWRTTACAATTSTNAETKAVISRHKTCQTLKII